MEIDGDAALAIQVFSARAIDHGLLANEGGVLREEGRGTRGKFSGQRIPFEASNYLRHES